jgi:hypothetical protein
MYLLKISQFVFCLLLSIIGLKARGLKKKRRNLNHGSETYIESNTSYFDELVIFLDDPQRIDGSDQL